MPEKTIKRRLQELDRELAGDDGPIFATVAGLVDAVKRWIPEGTENAEDASAGRWAARGNCCAGRGIKKNNNTCP
jgi:hypothetical protein